jgi:hypothetical protein
MRLGSWPVGECAVGGQSGAGQRQHGGGQVGRRRLTRSWRRSRAGISSPGADFVTKYYASWQAANVKRPGGGWR